MLNVKLLSLRQEKEGLEIALQKDNGRGNEAEKSKLERVRNLNTIKQSLIVLYHSLCQHRYMYITTNNGV